MVSVVVSTRNRAGQLTEMLDAIANQTLGREMFDVTVVDDGSTDATPEALAAEETRSRLNLSVVRRERSGGAAVGREEGWRTSKAPLIAFTDDDCVPDPEWLEAGLAASRRHPRAIIQGRTAPRPDELHRLGPFSRTIDVTALDHAFQTTNIFYPREVLESVGGFDTVAYEGAVGGEDTDLAWRAIEQGAETVFEPSALVYHAVNVLGARGLLRVAARSTAALPYARHSTIRDRDFVFGVFRKRTHLWLAMALLPLLLPRRLRLIAVLTAVPYVRALRARAIAECAHTVVVPFYVLHDLVEVVATVKGGLRGGRLML